MMTRRPNLDFLRRAIELATRNVTSGNGGPFAALIVRNGEVESVEAVSARGHEGPIITVVKQEAESVGSPL